mmetsp:Transcript_11160/g.31634  ORF Transcript_11160/g.31634 Transcript_11160/m.31634 type:complete len:1185 (+) Transcript_11160:474-4028(+)
MEFLRRKGRGEEAVRFDFTVHVKELGPWPPGRKSIAIGWQRGSKRKGSTRSKDPVNNGQLHNTYPFNETIQVPATLYRDAPEGSSSASFRRKCLALAVLETDGRTKATAVLGRVVINLAEYAGYDVEEFLSFPVACNRAIIAAVGQPHLRLDLVCRWKNKQAGPRRASSVSGASSVSTDTSRSTLSSNLSSFMQPARTSSVLSSKEHMRDQLADLEAFEDTRDEQLRGAARAAPAGAASLRPLKPFPGPQHQHQQPQDGESRHRKSSRRNGGEGHAAAAPPPVPPSIAATAAAEELPAALGSAGSTSRIMAGPSTLESIAEGDAGESGASPLKNPSSDSLKGLDSRSKSKLDKVSQWLNDQQDSDEGSGQGKSPGNGGPSSSGGRPPPSASGGKHARRRSRLRPPDPAAAAAVEPAGTTPFDGPVEGVASKVEGGPAVKELAVAVHERQRHRPGEAPNPSAETAAAGGNPFLHSGGGGGRTAPRGRGSAAANNPFDSPSSSPGGGGHPEGNNLFAEPFAGRPSSSLDSPFAEDAKSDNPFGNPQQQQPLSNRSNPFQDRQSSSGLYSFSSASEPASPFDVAPAADAANPFARPPLPPSAAGLAGADEKSRGGGGTANYEAAAGGHRRSSSGGSSKAGNPRRHRRGSSSASEGSNPTASLRREAARRQRTSALAEPLVAAVGVKEALRQATEQLQMLAALEAAIHWARGQQNTRLRRRTRRSHGPARRLARTVNRLGPVTGRTFGKRAIQAITAVAEGTGEDLTGLVFWWSNSLALRVLLTSDSFHAGSEGAELRAWEHAETELCVAVASLERHLFERTLQTVWWRVLVPAVASSDAHARRTLTQHRRPSVSAASRAHLEPGRGDEVATHRWLEALEAVRSKLCPPAMAQVGGHARLLASQVLATVMRRMDLMLFSCLLAGGVEQALPPVVQRGHCCAPYAEVAFLFPNLDEAVLPFPDAPLTFETGMFIKLALSRWEAWAGEAGLAPGKSSAYLTTQEGASLDLFPHLRCAADLLMLPKDMLADAEVREDICPALDLPHVVALLERFKPDDYAPDPVSQQLLAKLRQQLSDSSDNPRHSEQAANLIPDGSPKAGRRTAMLQAVLQGEACLVDQELALTSWGASGTDPLSLEFDADSEDELDGLMREVCSGNCGGLAGDPSYGSPAAAPGAWRRFALLKSLWHGS